MIGMLLCECVSLKIPKSLDMQMQLSQTCNRRDAAYLLPQWLSDFDVVLIYITGNNPAIIWQYKCHIQGIITCENT